MSCSRPLYVKGSTIGATGFQGATGPTGPTGDSYWQTTETEMYYDGGNVAIGKNTATVTLDVSGNVVIDGTLDVSGNLTTTQDALIHGLTIGYGSGNINSNTTIGYGALTTNTTGTSNTAVGNHALYANTSGYYNTAIGWNALPQNTTGHYNTAVGPETLFANTTGSSNISISQSSMYNNTTGSSNTSIGQGSMYNNTTGSSNTSIGQSTLVANISGNNNVAIGVDAGSSLVNGTNNIIIGTSAQASTTSTNNEITLGNTSISTLRCAVTTITSISDARDKKEIEPLDSGLRFVDQLKPVKFVWNMRDGGKVDIPEMGFIAQDLKQVQEDTGITIPNLVYESNPDRLEASYVTLLPILVKAVQELSSKVTSLETQLNELKSCP